MTVWVVIQWRETDGEATFGEIQGVFSTEDRAIAACRTWMFGYGPVELDRELPIERAYWLGWRYPIERPDG